jgi:hypothetical protein
MPQEITRNIVDEVDKALLPMFSDGRYLLFVLEKNDQLFVEVHDPLSAMKHIKSVHLKAQGLFQN